MFMGPLDAEKPWADEGISGCEKFLRRVWALYFDESDQLKAAVKVSSPARNRKVDQALHKCLKRVDDSFLLFNFNTAVAGMMEALNDINATGAGFDREQAEFFAKMLFPFAPHVSSEIWQQLGHEDLIDFANWPQLDLSMLVSDEFELVMQVNGKIRQRKLVPMNTPQEEAVRIAESDLAEHLAGKSLVKVIFVPNKLLNLVVKD